MTLRSLALLLAAVSTTNAAESHLTYCNLIPGNGQLYFKSGNLEGPRIDFKECRTLRAESNDAVFPISVYDETDTIRFNGQFLIKPDGQENVAIVTPGPTDTYLPRFLRAGQAMNPNRTRLVAMNTFDQTQEMPGACVSLFLASTVVSPASCSFFSPHCQCRRSK